MIFFITGNSATEAGLDLDFISPVNSELENFASKGQTLRQSYSIAQNIFRHVGKNKINFVLIGLTADSLFRDESENLSEDVFEENFQALNDYIKLCHDNGAKPIGIIFPFAPAVRERYREIFLKPLLNIFADLESLSDFKTVNFYDIDINEKGFSDEMHLTKEGAMKLSVVLTMTFRELKIFSEEDFSQMSYDYFNALSYVMDKNSFNELMAEIFSYSVAKIRRKKKIKVAFVTDHAATWCGDRLYNLFAQNDRFETTVFLTRGIEASLEDAVHDFKEFKAAGLNVVGIFDFNEETEPQDIIFLLRPYLPNFSKSFQFNVLTPQTLIAYISYGILAITWDFYFNFPPIYLSWKYFFDTAASLKLLNEKCRVGISRGVLSGAPKMDFFFEDTSKISFPWKMTRPDAKKIIWAPHWTIANINTPESYLIFQRNFQFMYDFAKAHQEISWVVKPHPMLMKSAVDAKLFPSKEAYKDYLQAWDDLPNALVYTGGYYQEIFATSDGMIHDCGSFVAEYQYTGKPMIYMLNNESKNYTELGKKILSVSYVVDGKNLDDIAFAIQKIFIEGNDPLKAQRRKVFDEDLNYPRFNGMLASDFIYKAITEELGEENFQWKKRWY